MTTKENEENLKVNVANPFLRDLNNALVEKIKARCGENIVADGIQCSHCGALETYKNGNNLNNTEEWFFLTRISLSPPP